MTAITGIIIENCGIAVREFGADESKRSILQRYLHDIVSPCLAQQNQVFSMADGPFASAKEYFAIQAEAYEKLAVLAGVDDDSLAKLLVDERDDQGPRRFIQSLPLRCPDISLNTLTILRIPHAGLTIVLAIINRLHTWIAQFFRYRCSHQHRHHWSLTFLAHQQDRPTVHHAFDWLKKYSLANQPLAARSHFYMILTQTGRALYKMVISTRLFRNSL